MGESNYETLIQVVVDAMLVVDHAGADPQRQCRRWPHLSLSGQRFAGHAGRGTAVQDNGPGLDPKTAQKAFDPFFTTKEHGLGMGLAVSRALIQANGGQLWNESTGQAGATFRFTLPLAP